ncbi:MAG: HD domain-containing protein [Pseudomonadota bacterium]
MKKIEEILNFIVEIEKLKGVQRKTKAVGFERYENSAEHSWQMLWSATPVPEHN